VACGKVMIWKPDACCLIAITNETLRCYSAGLYSSVRTPDGGIGKGSGIGLAINRIMKRLSLLWRKEEDGERKE
jgi:hypothetical protein